MAKIRPDLTRATQRVESLMVDRCVINRDVEGTGDDVFDPETGSLNPPPSDTTAVYTGKCFIDPTGIGQAEGAEGRPIQLPGLRTLRAFIPKNAPEIRVHDVLVPISSFRDPKLVGREMQVVGVQYSSFAVARQLEVVDLR